MNSRARVLCCLVPLLALAACQSSGGGNNQAPPAPTNTVVAQIEAPTPGVTDYYTYDLSWDAAVDPDGDSVSYLAEVWSNEECSTPFDFTSATAKRVKSSGWITALTWRADELPSLTSEGVITCLGFRVKARDTRLGQSPWANHTDWFGSCPFLFAWDGEKFSFESDVYTAGKLGIRVGEKFVRPFPQDYYILTHSPAAKDGALVLQLTSELPEVEYTDQASLYALYAPEGTTVYSEMPRWPYATSFDPATGFHTTVGPLRAPLGAIHVNTGRDVAALLSASDGALLTLNVDPNHTEYQTVELDLGDLSAAPMVKLILDGRSQFATSRAGIDYQSKQGQRTKVEVPDAAGKWVEVPSSQVVMSPLPGYRRPVVLDLTGAFPAHDYRVRLTWLLKTVLDSVLLDTSADQPFRLVELPLLSADLHERGVSGVAGGAFGELVYDRVFPARFDPFPGAYTRYGDVTPLLTAADDMFVITFGGEEITLRYDLAPAPAPGEALQFVLLSSGYYKEAKVPLTHTVEPLPFAAMSNYPYPDTEGYPTDAAHQAYQAEWNTRIVAP